MRFYGYEKCSTCRKAKAYLLKRGKRIAFIDITTSPPPKPLLRLLLRSGAYQLSDLFNRSGEFYRSLHMKEKMNTLSESPLLDLLATHGRLLKRPIIPDGMKYTVGFDERAMSETWG